MFSILFKQPHNYRPELDFLRFCAIFLVFLTHAAQCFSFIGGGSNWFTNSPLVLGGWVGVDLFFVLSGFLIGGQLWKEYEMKGTINYRDFLIKRTLRIWPLYYFIMILFLIIRGPISEGWLFSDFYFLSNYFPQGGIKGSWSLSTEEQFYIFLPLMLWFFSNLKINLRGARYFMIGILILSPLIRYFVWQDVSAKFGPSMRNEIDYLYFPFHTHLDGLFMGALLANIFVDKKFIWSWSRTALILGFLTLLSLVLRLKFRVYFNYSFFAMIFGTSLWILIHLKGPWLKIMSWKIFSLMARLSFGIYLVHYQILKWITAPVFNLVPLADEGLRISITSIIIFGVCITVTTITFLLIEHPALKLRNKILSVANET